MMGRNSTYSKGGGSGNGGYSSRSNDENDRPPRPPPPSSRPPLHNPNPHREAAASTPNTSSFHQPPQHPPPKPKPQQQKPLPQPQPQPQPQPRTHRAEPRPKPMPFSSNAPHSFESNDNHIHENHPHPSSSISPNTSPSNYTRGYAQERRKNQQLLQRIRELERSLALLQKERGLEGDPHDGPDDNATDNDNASSSASASANDSTRREQHGEYSKRISELEEALKCESRRRQELEIMLENQTPSSHNIHHDASIANSEMTSPPTHSPKFQMFRDDSVVQLLERASALLSSDIDGSSADATTSAANRGESNANDRHYHLTYPASQENDVAATTNTTISTATKEKMDEYHELVTEFHMEQRNAQDEVIAKEDVLWFFDQLQWRFEEIRRGYDAEWKEWMEASTVDVGNGALHDTFDKKEWRKCLMGLVDFVGRATEQSSDSSLSVIDGEGDNRTLCRKDDAETTLDCNHPLHNHHQQPHRQQLAKTPISPRKHTERSGNATIRLLQNEITHLNHRLSSFAKHHNDTCNSLYHDMETMKLNYEERICDMSSTISRLESELSEKNTCIARLQKENEHDRLMMEDVKSSLELTKEGTKARIKYLEDTVVDLERELKKEKSINVAVMSASSKNDDS
ncbi:hypothetical protein ACHAXS_005247 [Conticribra weissflogii]